MKKIEFTRPMTMEPELHVRSAREALIADIVNATQEKDKRKLAKRLAMAANTLHWQEIDLHALLQKRNDPNVRNYTAFVWWSCKIRG